MIVTALHPACVVHVPHRGRNQRLDLVRVATPIEVPEVEFRDLEAVRWPLFDFQTPPRPAYRHDGGFWTALSSDGTGKTTGAAALRAYLAGASGHFHLDLEFAGTPLCAIVRNDSPMHFDERERREKAGVEVDVDRSREVLRDDRERAALALHAYVGRSLRLFGGAAYVRREPVACLWESGPSYGGIVGIHRTGRLQGYVGGVAGQDTFEAMLAHVAARVGSPTHSPEIQPWLETPFGDALDGVAHRLVAASFPGAVRRQCEDEAGRPHRIDDAPRLLALAAALRSAEIDAMAGLTDPDPRRPLGLLLDALEAAIPTIPGEKVHTRGPEFLRDMLRDHYLPTLPAREPPSEDVAALAFAR
jgi:hypothetical protein